ncbi:hypothetical protein J3E72DRAFT_49701 [Bipolaris maydis]|uniref:uncharacterized protein n=1 Tax=Cochliobolus heterostrophus TaxID=5016 RepID=UPI0024D13645|nr:hypothetical protein J3E73DRAFT_47080 [Bipolaris maydis]KAJ5056648.1 hypothetical protein J3E74DRAFT_14798 [Bipolaris maydis]KAJ6196237.1 hypothetical protein J3E72DRAFT_49701 [Bipolaris maydis]KAJ6208338.1 hypothetical protein PSV09DRAFT_2044595 [Bipolaris maydis]KAJ6270323.1 hypothetical protein PSV08DRAFT_45453 [Bipolaris maydis]
MQLNPIFAVLAIALGAMADWTCDYQGVDISGNNGQYSCCAPGDSGCEITFNARPLKNEESGCSSKLISCYVT